MMDSKNEKIITVAAGSDTAAAGGRGSIVPATPSSSSYVGPPRELGASSRGEVAICFKKSGPKAVQLRGKTKPKASPKAGTSQPVVRLQRVDRGGMIAAGISSLAKGMNKSQAIAVAMRQAHTSPDPQWEDSVLDSFSSSSSSDGEESMDVDVEDVLEEQRKATEAVERGRGRPPTTQEYTGMTAARADRLAVLEKEVRLKEALYVLDVKAPPKRTRGRDSLPSEEEIMAEFQTLKTSQIYAKACRHLMAVDKTSDVSKGLQSTLSTTLRRAAREVTVALSVLMERARSGSEEPVPSQELRALQAYVQALKREKEQADAEVDDLKGSLAAVKAELASARASVSPSRRPPALKRKLRNRVVDMEQEEEADPPVRDTEWCPNIPAPITAPTTVDRGTSPGPTTTEEDPTPCGLSTQEVEALLERIKEQKVEIDNTRAEMAEVLDSSISAMQKCREENRELRKKLELWEKEKEKSSSSKTGASRGGNTAGGPSSSVKRGGEFSAVRNVPVSGGDNKDLWSKVVGRRSAGVEKRQPRASKGSAAPLAGAQTGSGAAKPDKTRRKTSRKKKKKGPRAPATAAVTVTIAKNEGSDLTYARVMAEAREKISLEDLGIAGSRLRPSMMGGLIIEIPGKDRLSKARQLAERMKAVFQEKEDVRVTQPQKTAELRVRGLDVACTSKDVSQAISALTGCLEDQIRVGEIRRSTDISPGSAWVCCPVSAASKLAREGRLQVGWSRVKVETLKARPVFCYRCLGHGHVRARCRAAVDRSTACYRCGESGHSAKGCTAPPRCLACADLGLPAGHRLGGKGCKPKPPSRRKEDVPLAERIASASSKQAATKSKQPGRLAVKRVSAGPSSSSASSSGQQKLARAREEEVEMETDT